MQLALYLLLYSLLFIEPTYAYIDPGTGSMLFSVVLCSIATVFYLIKSFMIKIKSGLFFKIKRQENKKNFVIYSEGKQYYCVFKPILDEFEKREISLTYYTSSEDDPVFADEYKFIEKKYIGKGNSAYFKLAFLNADVCLMTTPHLDVMQLKRSKYTKHYCHIFHSITFSLGYGLFALDYYDSILCDGQFQIPLIREIEKKRNLPSKKLEVIGSTYMDYYKSKISEKNENSKFTILVAPSWGEHSLLNKFGDKILNILSKKDYNIIIRPHPQSLIADKKLVDKLSTKYNNVTWDYNSSNIESLSKADILISDFSCVMMDFAFLFKKPFLYVKTDINLEIYDCSDLDEIPWGYRIADKIGMEFDIDKDNLENCIEKIRNDKTIQNNIEEACKYAWEYQGQSAQRAVDFLVKIQKEVSEK